MTDTDSLVYQIFTDDLYKDMESMKDKLDTSNYPEDHPLFSNVNKKVVGKFKDENGEETYGGVYWVETENVFFH